MCYSCKGMQLLTGFFTERCNNDLIFFTGFDCKFINICRGFIVTCDQKMAFVTLREKCPNAEFFLDDIFPHSDWIRRFTEYLSVFTPNAGKYGPEKTPYLDTFYAVSALAFMWLFLNHWNRLLVFCSSLLLSRLNCCYLCKGYYHQCNSQCRNH